MLCPKSLLLFPAPNHAQIQSSPGLVGDLVETTRPGNEASGNTVCEFGMVYHHLNSVPVFMCSFVFHAAAHKSG